MLLLSDHLFIPSYYHLVHATRTSSSDFVTSHNNRPALRRNLCDIRPRPTTFSSSIARHKLGGWTFTTLSLLLVLARSSSSSTVVVRASTTFSYVGAALFVGALPSSHEASSFRRAMSTSTTTSRTSDGTITVSPRRETDQSALVVVCHGLGDTAEGFVDVAELLATKLPYCKFVLPTAPTNPVTLNGGMRMNSWYNIVGLDERSNEQCDGIDESRQRVTQILIDEHNRTKLPYSRMVLAGFSQGGALSLFTGLQFNHPLAGIVVLSGYLPCAQRFRIAPGLESTPIFHGHGTQDMIVNYGMAQKTRALLLERGIQQYNLKTYSIGHTVSNEEIGHLTDFLRQVLPDDPNCRVTLPDPHTMSIKELKAAIQRAGLSHKAAGFCEKSEFVKLLQDHRAQ